LFSVNSKPAGKFPRSCFQLAFFKPENSGLIEISFFTVKLIFSYTNPGKHYFTPEYLSNFKLNRVKKRCKAPLYRNKIML
jgi:hypothetical protein